MNTFKETTVNKNYIYRGKILNLRCDDAVLPDGKPCKREIVEHTGGAAVLCVKDGGVMLVRQFRYAYGEEIWEIPAGKLNAREDPMFAAKRELEEETGMNSVLTHLITIYPTPGYTNEKIYIYLAEGGTQGEQALDEGEFLSVKWVPLADAYRMIDDGEIKDAKTIIALLQYRAMKK